MRTAQKAVCATGRYAKHLFYGILQRRRDTDASQWIKHQCGPSRNFIGRYCTDRDACDGIARQPTSLFYKRCGENADQDSSERVQLWHVVRRCWRILLRNRRVSATVAAGRYDSWMCLERMRVPAYGEVASFSWRFIPSSGAREHIGSGFIKSSLRKCHHVGAK